MFGAEGAHPPPGKCPEALQGPFIDMGAAERQIALLRRRNGDLRLARIIDPGGNAGGDEGAGADFCHGKTVRDQPFIGRRDGVATEAGLLGERAGRRQRLVRLCDAAGDGVAKRLVEPVLGGGSLRDMRP